MKPGNKFYDINVLRFYPEDILIYEEVALPKIIEILMKGKTMIKGIN